MAWTVKRIQEGDYGCEERSEEDNSCYPPIDHPSDVLGMISLDQMVIPDDGIYDGRSVCLAFSCSWDDENGMGVRFLNEKIDEIGYQDIVF